MVRPRRDLGPGRDGDAAGRLPIPGTEETSLRDRLPEDLRGTVADVDFGSLPFVPLYLHRRRVRRGDLEPDHARRDAPAWADQGEGRYQAQMAVYVKTHGRFGEAYMALIKPFRYLIVYPALMRQTERMWNERPPRRAAPA